MKWVVRIGVLLLVLVLGFFASSYWWLDRAAKRAIEVAGAEAMGVTVTLEKINIGVLRGEATLDSLNIANPRGYKKPYFFHLDSGMTEVSLRTLTEETVEIPTIELTGITIYIEPDKNGKYNYETILENIEASSERSQKEPESETKIIVRRLALRDMKIYYRLKNLDFIETPVRIDEYVIENIGEEGSEVDMEELMSIIVTGALRGIASRMPQIIVD